MTIDSESAPWMFPTHLGPSIRNLTTALMFHGHLNVDVPGWLSTGPPDVLARVLARAQATNNPLVALLHPVAHFASLAMKQAAAEIQHLEPLNPYLTKVKVVYAGTTSAYSEWDSIRAACIPLAAKCLDSPQALGTASLELMWRLWEYALENGLSPDDPTGVDPDLVLAYLAGRAAALGDPMQLLPECFLTRFVISREIPSIVTDSVPVLQALTAIGNLAGPTPDPSSEFTAETLAFIFFDSIVSPHTRSLTPDYAPIAATLLSTEADALERMRRKCRHEALELLSLRPSSPYLTAAIRDGLQHMSEEAASIAQIDRTSMRSYLRALAEDFRIWTAVAGLLGSAATLPDIVTASFAVTTLSLFGASGVKQALERRETLATSPWSFIYHARRVAN